MSDTPKMIQLYPPDDGWMPCEAKIGTQYGCITYYEWLQRERERIEASDGRIATIRVSHGKCALYVNAVAEDGNGEKETSPAVSTE